MFFSIGYKKGGLDLFHKNLPFKNCSGSTPLVKGKYSFKEYVIYLDVLRRRLNKQSLSQKYHLFDDWLASRKSGKVGVLGD